MARPGSAELRSALKVALADEIALELLKNSSMTQAQLETVLIQSLGPNVVGSGDVDVLRRFRVNRAVSRGSFNRTLLQARVNVRRAMYTLLLLGYLGLLEDVKFEPFVELGSKLQLYVQEAQAGGARQFLMERIKEELELIDSRIRSKRDL